MVKMKKLMLLLLSASLCSCSILGGFRAPMNIVSSERDAQIFINGAYQGNGVIQTTVPRNENVSILVKKEAINDICRRVTAQLRLWNHFQVDCNTKLFEYRF